MVLSVCVSTTEPPLPPFQTCSVVAEQQQRLARESRRQQLNGLWFGGMSVDTISDDEAESTWGEFAVGMHCEETPETPITTQEAVHTAGDGPSTPLGSWLRRYLPSPA